MRRSKSVYAILACMITSLAQAATPVAVDKIECRGKSVHLQTLAYHGIGYASTAIAISAPATLAGQYEAALWSNPLNTGDKTSEQTYLIREGDINITLYRVDGLSKFQISQVSDPDVDAGTSVLLDEEVTCHSAQAI